MDRCSRRFKAVVVLTILLFPALAGAKGSCPKIGVVDIEKIYKAYSKAQETRKFLELEKSKKQKELERRKRELEDLKSEYEREKGKLSPEEKVSFERRISEKEKELNTFLQRANEYLMREAKFLIGKRADEIEDAVREYGKKHGFTVILDKKTLPYFSNSVDITDDVIRMLNGN